MEKNQADSTDLIARARGGDKGRRIPSSTATVTAFADGRGSARHPAPGASGRVGRGPGGVRGCRGPSR